MCIRDRCSSATDPYGAATLSKTGNYHYALDGTGVDIVIMDSGVKNDHPEFQDAAGNSRVKEIDWYAASGGNMSGTMPTNFYTQQDNHGTFCAGISAGKTYGWAKNADIYVMKNFDTDALPTETGLDLIRHWHNNKGTGRPTVVNMSFGFIYSAFGGAQSGDTGNHWNTVTNQFDSWTYGDSGYENATNIKFKVDIRSSGNLSKKVSSVDAKIDQMIAAGIHIVVAGGNGDDCQFEYTANTNNNYYDYVVRSGFNGGANVYYHQSSSPMTTNNGSDIRVGNINNSNYDSGREILVSSSARGPAIDIHAPGTEIVSTTAGQGASYNQVNYPSNSSYKIGRSTGTSFSAPQVTGLSALYLQLHPTYTPAQLKTAILGDAKLDLIHDELSTFNGASSKYLTLYGLWGSPNRYMFNKFHGDMVAKWS